MNYQENEAKETRNRWLTVGVSVASLVLLGIFGTQISTFLNSGDDAINNKSSFGSGFSFSAGNSAMVDDPACYVVADRPDPDNTYYYDLTLPVGDPNWETQVGTGDAGRNNIEASEYDPVSGTLFAWDKADFGYIDLNTGAFVSLGTSPGNVCGYQAGIYVCFDGTNGVALGMTSGTYDIDGMAYNPISDKWYGSVRIKDGSATESWSDWLVEYDSNGGLIPDAFGYDAQGNPIGFLEVAWFTGSDGLDLHDIDDLAFDPTNGQLYGIANRSGGSVTHMVAIDITNGSVTDLGTISTTQDCNGDGASPEPLLDVEGLSIDLQGRIWAVTGAFSGGGSCSNSMWEWNGALDGTPITATYYSLLSETDQESITCSVYEPVSVGDTIWLDSDGDGTQNGGENGIAGVILYLTNAAGDTLGTATTDANGNYLFDGLLPDANGYTVIVGTENFDPGGVLEGFSSTNDPDSGPGAGDNQGTSSSLPNGGDEDLSLDFGFIDTPLPVELIGLSAESAGDRDIRGLWSTATETNNAGFSVEYSSRGAAYKEAGFVAGKGNSDVESGYEYLIENLSSGTYLIRLKQIDLDGQIAYSNEVEAALSLPKGYSLEAAYPNPFNPTSNISFTVSESKPVALRMYNSAGQMVKLLYQGTAQANNSLQVKIDAANLPAGTYIVRLEGENISASQKVVLLK